ncbi:uncharacterized protein LOC132751901 [Ruditapes philippinarum]|uniref:uncharacterized protein LOC132751901 n=1 Tax=Ruditapes philippinarum TaxID=129788 RepID=UPI00295AB778|nr:uncharacterized protein LOC132751901 [Ruditapes philippinarum]
MELKVSIATIGLLLIFLASLPDIKAENVEDVDERDPGYKELIKRMENIEARDNVNTELNHRILALENLVKGQQSQISSLQETIEKQADVNKQLHDRVQYLESRDKANGAIETEMKSQKKRIQVVEEFIKNLGDKHTTVRENGGKERTVNKIVQRNIRSIQRRENEQTVAFFAYLTNHIENPGVHQIIAFDHVTTNIGNGYNAFAGDFRAPVAGTYVFATTLMAGSYSTGYHFQIMQNAQYVSNIYIPNGGTASQEVVLQLNQGDNVSIHNIDAGQPVYGHGYSTFSGFLLQQNYSSPGIVGK